MKLLRGHFDASICPFELVHEQYSGNDVLYCVQTLYYDLL